MAKPCTGWGGGVTSQHVLDLPEAHQHYCNEHDPERHGAQEGTQRGEPEPSSAPCAGVASGAEPPTQDGEGSSGPPGSSARLKMPVAGVEQLFILP